jgi:hypothetical protein
VGAEKDIIICPKFPAKPLNRNLCPEFLLHRQKQQKDSIMMLAGYNSRDISK